MDSEKKMTLYVLPCPPIEFEGLKKAIVLLFCPSLSLFRYCVGFPWLQIS